MNIEVTTRPNFRKSDDEKQQLSLAKLAWRNEMRKKYKNFKKRGFCSAKYDDVIV